MLIYITTIQFAPQPSGLFMQKFPALSSWTDTSARNCSHRSLSNRISEVTDIFKCSSSCKCWFIYSLNRAHLKRKDQNQTQVATPRDLRTPMGLTDPVPREMPDALGGRLTALLPSCPNTPRSLQPPWHPGRSRALARSTCHTSQPAGYLLLVSLYWLIVPRGIPGSCVPANYFATKTSIAQHTQTAFNRTWFRVWAEKPMYYDKLQQG